jgi:hypothetical protein
MGILNKVLVGIGSYLIKKGELDEQAAREQLLFDRQVALKQLESQIDDKKSERDHTARLGEIAATGSENRRTDVFKGIIDQRVKQQEEADKLKHDITIKGIDFSNEAKLEGLKHKYKLSEDQFSSMLQSDRDAKAAGTTIDRVVFSKDGQMQQIYKNGTVVSRGPSGAYNASGAAGGDLGDYLDTGGTASGSAVSNPTGIGPTASSGAGPSAHDAALARLGNVYAQASQNPEQFKSVYPGMFDANGNLLPKDALIARVNQQFGPQ